MAGPKPKARDRLLAAADELFYNRGIHATGVDEIVQRAGTAKTTLYAHFRTKNDLIAGYLARRSANWRTQMEAELERADGTPELELDTIFAVLASGCDAPGFRGCPFINAAAEFPDSAHPARKVANEHRTWVKNLILERARAAELEEPETVADELVLLYDAAMVGKQFDPAGHAAARARATAFSIIENATRRTD